MRIDIRSVCSVRIVGSWWRWNLCLTLELENVCDFLVLINLIHLDKLSKMLYWQKKNFYFLKSSCAILHINSCVFQAITTIHICKETLERFLKINCSTSLPWYLVFPMRKEMIWADSSKQAWVFYFCCFFSPFPGDIDYHEKQECACNDDLSVEHY